MLRLGKVSMLFVALTVVTALGACGSDAKSTTSSASTSSASSSSAPLTGSVTVFAAASLTEAFNAEKATLEAANPGFLVTYSFGGSGALVQQVTQGAPADII